MLLRFSDLCDDSIFGKRNECTNAKFAFVHWAVNAVVIVVAVITTMTIFHLFVDYLLHVPI